MTSRRHSSNGIPAALALPDSLCIAVAYWLAVYHGIPANIPLPEALLSHLPYLGIFIVVWLASAVDRRLWSGRRNEDLVSYLTAVTKAVCDGAVVCVVVMAFVSRTGLERRFLVFFPMFTLVTLLTYRVTARLIAWELRRLGYNVRKALVVGANERAVRLIEVMEKRKHYGYHIEGFLEDEAGRARMAEAAGIPWLGPVNALREILDSRRIDEVYVSLPVRSSYQTIQDITHYCEGAGVPVHLLADLFRLRIATSRLMHIDDIPLLSLSTVPETQLRLAIKRVIDFTLSSILLVVFAPLLLAIAVLIKLDSRGPILFAQERVGQNQRRFNMLKFRSMVSNAEALKASLAEQNEADGPVFKIREDPRITRIGKYLRRYSLDELPQLINVWRGQMSLVGPRPPLASEVEQYSWSQRRRLSVKPGMTGLWQVSGRSDVSFTEWVEMDLAYIDSWSIGQDFIILLKTFGAVLGKRGAA